jgi:hypothetical protein
VYLQANRMSSMLANKILKVSKASDSMKVIKEKQANQIMKKFMDADYAMKKNKKNLEAGRTNLDVMTKNE